MQPSEATGKVDNGTAEPSFLRHVLRLVWTGLRRYRGRCSKLVLFGFAGSAAQVAAFLLLIPILRQVASSSELAPLEMSVRELGVTEYSLYVLGVAALFSVYVGMKYLVISSAYHLSQDFTADCAEAATEAAQARLRYSAAPATVARRMVNQALFSMPPSCGLLLRQVLLVLNEILLLAILVAVLAWLSPMATAAMIVLGAPLIAMYLRSFTQIADQTQLVAEEKKWSRIETRKLVAAVQDPDTTSDGIRDMVRDLFNSGRPGRALSGKIAMRRQMRGSSAFVELLTPVAVIVVSYLFYFSGTLDLDLAMIFVYYLIVRQAISAATQVADGLVAVIRVYPGLSSYLDLIHNPHIRPGEWMQASGRQPDED